MDYQIIKTLIDSLNNNEEKKINQIKEQYKNARLSIQEFCNHPETEAILAGHRCTICGKLIKYNSPEIYKYIRKEV